ncbi:hypothetical protein [Vibrio crassostreae]|uniref:hypothetical protein n=1 Tax=Vibrio crassostreae TaxID=246167 RepID=UPI001B317DCE|nr:hypothetical protein [Vibrio crassostreae]
MREFIINRPNTKPTLPFTDYGRNLCKEDGWCFEHYDCGDGFIGCRIKVLNKEKFKSPTEAFVFIENKLGALIGGVPVKLGGELSLNAFLDKSKEVNAWERDEDTSREDKLERRLQINVYSKAVSFFKEYCPEQYRQFAFEKKRFLGPHKIYTRSGTHTQYHQYTWNVCSCRSERCDICQKIVEYVKKEKEQYLNGKPIAIGDKEVKETKTKNGVEYSYFACNCKEENHQRYEQMVKDHCQRNEMGKEFLTSSIVASLNCEDWYINGMFQDQWGVLSVANEDNGDTMRIQCDSFEHGMVVAEEIAVQVARRNQYLREDND